MLQLCVCVGGCVLQVLGPSPVGTGMLRENHLVHRESVNFEPQLLKHFFLDWLFLVMKIRYSTGETKTS